LLVSRRTVAAPYLESLSWVPHVLPGILLSLGVLWLFLATPLRFFLYGTVWGIALALILADSPVTTQAFKAGLLQLGADLEESARVSGATWSYTYRRILLPLLAPIARVVPDIEAAFCALWHDDDVLDHLGGGEVKNFAAVILAVGPADAAARDVGAAEVDAFNLAVVDVDLVLEPGLGHHLDLGCEHLERDVMLDPVGSVEVCADGRFDQVEQRAEQPILVVIGELHDELVAGFELGAAAALGGAAQVGVEARFNPDLRGRGSRGRRPSRG